MQALGSYGSNRGQNISIADDAEIWYNYRISPSMADTSQPNWVKITNPQEMLEAQEFDDQITSMNMGGSQPILDGAYNLVLPLTRFNKKGVYTILIKPKEVYTTIVNGSQVLNQTGTRGIIINKDDIKGGSSSALTDGNIVGYRIDYFSNGQRQNFYRIVTSNNAVEQMMVANNINSQQTKYNFNDASNLVFLSLSPSGQPSFKPNQLPFIGETGQTIGISNTSFNAQMIEITMTDTDMDTIKQLLVGPQLLAMENSLITTYTDDYEILNQVETFELKNSSTGDAIYQARDKVNSIIPQSWDNIVVQGKI